MNAKKIIPGVVVLLVGLAAAWYQGLLADMYAHYSQRPPLETRQPWEAIKVIAHRGDHQAVPENTLESFRKAISRKYAFLEIDVRLTADGVPVVLHDSSVDRTTNGEGEIVNLTYAQTQQLDAGSWLAPEFAGAKIPALEEVLDEALGKVCILIDLKVVPDYQLVKTLKEYSQLFGHDCFMVSLVLVFDYGSMEGARHRFPMESLSAEGRRELNLVAKRSSQRYFEQYLVFKRYWPDFPQVGSYREQQDMSELFLEKPGLVAVGIPFVQGTPEMVKELHSMGLLVYTRLTLNEDDDLERAAVIYTKQMESGIDLIFTAYPDGFMEFQADYISNAKH
jgi:glycerophosphoryl diester phosphodiesterase